MYKLLTLKRFFFQGLYNDYDDFVRYWFSKCMLDYDTGKVSTWKSTSLG